MSATMDAIMNDAGGRAALERFHEQMSAQIGVAHRRALGRVDARTICRYAVAIGDPNPLYTDERAARAAGYNGLLAPPNMLSAVVEWGGGRFEADLAPDGTSSDYGRQALRIMGAGESMELLEPVVEGVELFDDEVVEAVELKQGRSGPLVFVTTRHDFTDADGTVLNRNRRTILARPATE